MIFDERKLRDEIVKVWGEHGAHCEVYDELLGRPAASEVRGLERAAGIAAGYKIARCESHRVDAVDTTAYAIEEDIRQAITNPDQFATADKLIHKQIACEFFRWWHNQLGSNTEQGFDDWWEKRREGK